MGNNSADQILAGVVDSIRYRQILFFFGRVVAHLVWWDILLRRIMPGRVLASRPERWRQLSHRFRGLAVQMGGVLIKLGQFLSARVDVLPVEITQELQGLQDEVPAVDTAQILAVLEAELGYLPEHFSEIELEPLAAASLGQVHRAWLADEAKTAVVVKVQRPGIINLVQTDLAALRVVARWVMRYKPIRRRADVPALMEEFAKTLGEELDYEAEANHATRFAQMFADNEGVRIPKLYGRHCTGRVIVLENVEGIKVTDLAAMAAAGIDSKEVANRLLDTYLRQIFQEGFFHADPHPGNLFVLARPGPLESPTPFQLVFVDFGMVGRISPKMSQNLRKWLLSITQRNARGLTEVYQALGFFLPGADLEQITEAQTVFLDQMWGRNLLEMARPDPREIEALGQQFRDLLFEFPFQVPQDFIYLGRAIGMLSGLTSALDPQINPWYQMERLAEQLVDRREIRQAGFEAVLDWLKPFVTLPGQIQRILTEMESGRLRLQTSPDKATQQRLRNVERKLTHLQWTILAAAGLISGTLWYRRRKQ